MDNFGKDILFDFDLRNNVSADLSSITGYDNIKQAIFHRLITVPGTLIHRPKYGVGITRYKGEVNSISKQREIALLVKEQLELDYRIEEVESISIVHHDELNPAIFKIIVRVKLLKLGSIEEEFNPF
jgi:hypothetical protein